MSTKNGRYNMQPTRQFHSKKLNSNADTDDAVNDLAEYYYCQQSSSPKWIKMKLYASEAVIAASLFTTQLHTIRKKTMTTRL